MKIKTVELKAVKILQSLSEETICFTANIYVNGKKAGWAKNTGNGGSNHYRFEERAVQTAVEAWAACWLAC